MLHESTFPPVDGDREKSTFEKKQDLFKAVSAFFHTSMGGFPFSHGMDKVSTFTQEAQLLDELKTLVIIIDETYRVKITPDDPRRDKSVYMNLFKEKLMKLLKQP